MSLISIFHQYDFNLAYAKALVAELSESQMTSIPTQGLENHPAWTLGHLVSGSAILAEDLGAELDLPEGWKELFLRRGPGDPRKPLLDVVYPSKGDLVAELERQHERVKSLALKLNEDQLQEPFNWRFGNFFPQLIDLIAFLCINHEAMHLGQLAAWRRAQGLDSALAKLPHRTKPY